MWAVFYEKVWAKVTGNYQNTFDGLGLHAFDLLLGAPGEIINMTNIRVGYSSVSLLNAGLNAFNIIKTAITTNNYLVTVKTKISKKKCSSNNLVYDKTYSALETYSLVDGAKTYNLIRLRNPWGVESCNNKSYTGNWNDGDTAHWTINHIAEVPSYLNKNDGIFFMEASDFVQNF